MIRAAGNDPRKNLGARPLLFPAAAVLFAIQAFGRNDSDVDFLAAGLALMAIAFALGGGGAASCSESARSSHTRVRDGVRRFGKGAASPHGGTTFAFA